MRTPPRPRRAAAAASPRGAHRSQAAHADRPAHRLLRRLRTGLAFLCLSLAFVALLYPLVANYFAAQQSVLSESRYSSAVSSLPKSQVDSILAAAREYNRYIAAPWLHEDYQGTAPDYSRTLVVPGSAAMAYLSIPQLDLKDIPVYHGTAQATLAAGIGHIRSSSLPIGGPSTHSVLSAHSGLAGNALFSDLQDLKIGDIFLIKVLGSTHEYRIESRQIVDPADSTAATVYPGRDLVTLVTCWPLGIDSQRLLVTGHRVPYDATALNQALVKRNTFGYDFWAMLGAVLLALLALGWLILALRHRRRHIVRVSRAQFLAIRSGAQDLLLVSQGLVADSGGSSDPSAYAAPQLKHYQRGHTLVLRAWEPVADRPEPVRPLGQPDQGSTGRPDRLSIGTYVYWHRDSAGSWQPVSRARQASQASYRIAWRAEGLDSIPQTDLPAALAFLQAKLGSSQVPAGHLLIQLQHR